MRLPSHESHGRGASRAIDLTHGLERLKTGFRNAPHWRTRSAAEVCPTQYAHCPAADATSTRVCRVYRMGLRSNARRSAQWYANGAECPPSEPPPSVRTEIRLDGNDETHTRIPARPTANVYISYRYIETERYHLRSSHATKSTSLPEVVLYGPSRTGRSPVTMRSVTFRDRRRADDRTRPSVGDGLPDPRASDSSPQIAVSIRSTTAGGDRSHGGNPSATITWASRQDLSCQGRNPVDAYRPRTGGRSAPISVNRPTDREPCQRAYDAASRRSEGQKRDARGGRVEPPCTEQGLLPRGRAEHGRALEPERTRVGPETAPATVLATGPDESASSIRWTTVQRASERQGSCRRAHGDTGPS